MRCRRYPWEAPHRSGEPTVFQEGTLAVRAAYRARGVQPRKLQRVPDDHVALECAFMAREARFSLAQLIAGDVRELAAGLRAQQSFVVEHMTAWLGEYAKGLRRSATAVLYPQAAEALAAFVALDATFLAESALWTEEVSAIGRKVRSAGSGRRIARGAGVRRRRGGSGGARADASLRHRGLRAGGMRGLKPWQEESARRVVRRAWIQVRTDDDDDL